MPGLQKLVEKFLQNIDENNTQLKDTALDYRVCQLKSSTEEEKENYKGEISVCMILIARKEEFINGKIHRTRDAFKTLENNPEAKFLKDFDEKSIANLKKDFERLGTQKELLKSLWYNLKDLLPIGKRLRNSW